MSTLYIVATPIGNLEDITLRALNVLKSADAIICEDTRVTKKLLDKFEIKKPLISYNAHASEAKEESILRELQDGKNLAFVSDAGTPGISDPGTRLISKIVEKAELETAITVMPIPGASAVIAALSASGLPSSDFLFLGFLPHKKGRETLFREIFESERTAVFYESPHRIMKTLEHLSIHLERDRKVVVARELTKIHEELVRGSASKVLEYFIRNEDKVRGEFVVSVQGK